MKIGMLWFDNAKNKSLEQIISEAAKYYQGKYGKTANLVYVHPSQAPEQSTVIGIDVTGNKAVLPCHYWIGCRDNLDTIGSRE